MAVTKWRHYLWGRQFIINTDHESFKFLLEHKFTSQLQHKSLTKLMGLDYVIQSKKGIENKAADALSRGPHEEPMLGELSTLAITHGENYALSEGVSVRLAEVAKSYEGDTLLISMTVEYMLLKNVSNLIDG